MRLSMPHPVLFPRNSDYTDEYKFDAKIKIESQNNTMSLSIKYNLTSETLKNLIMAGKAKYFLVAKCTRTSHRDVHSTDKNITNWDLDLSYYEGKITFTPYIANVEKLDSFNSPEHVIDMHYFSPNGFDLPVGSILAIADPYEITLSTDRNAESIISIIQSDTIEKNRYAIDFNEEYILIMLHRETFIRINNMRNNPSQSLLHPSLYMVALEHAIREIAENEDEHKGRRWVESIQSIMEKRNLAVDNEKTISSTHEIAQILLEDPLSMLFKITVSDEDE